MDGCRVIVFPGDCKGVTVYITQRILLKSRPPSALNSELISSLPSCHNAWRPLNGRSGCYGRPGLSHLLLPVEIVLQSWDLERHSVYGLWKTHTHWQNEYVAHTSETKKSHWNSKKDPSATETHTLLGTRTWFAFMWKTTGTCRQQTCKKQVLKIKLLVIMLQPSF